VAGYFDVVAGVDCVGEGVRDSHADTRFIEVRKCLLIVGIGLYSLDRPAMVVGMRLSGMP